ncbi:MAG: hypothetical protein HXY43_10885 [Fischerella sp.]|jgi:hypothetical protein|uniref:hypothetical protein n=1 Tax=unclassified Fischerella TaxID=494603 RepID=UPI0004BCC6FB|nr:MULTISPECIES: hypothetical protein [unclassified Fischerella]NWF59771.1 hypothetical protein [Fischerella sp.]
MDNFHNIPPEQPAEVSLDLARVNEESWPHSIEYQDLIAFGATGGESIIAASK